MQRLANLFHRGPLLWVMRFRGRCNKQARIVDQNNVTRPHRGKLFSQRAFPASAQAFLVIAAPMRIKPQDSRNIWQIVHQVSAIIVHKAHIAQVFQACFGFGVAWFVCFQSGDGSEFAGCPAGGITLVGAGFNKC